MQESHAVGLLLPSIKHYAPQHKGKLKVTAESIVNQIPFAVLVLGS